MPMQSHVPAPLPASTENLRAFLVARIVGTELGGRTVHHTVYRTAIAFLGHPGEHVGWCVGQSFALGVTPRNEDEREFLVVCNDGIGRWFTGVESLPVL